MPSMLRLNSEAAYRHNRIILIDSTGFEHVVLNSSATMHNMPSDSKDMPQVFQRDYMIPHARFTVQVVTSSRKYAGGSRASIQFMVNGGWTPPQKLWTGESSGWGQGGILRKDFETIAWPSQLRLINDCTDAWGYKKITVFDSPGHEHVVLDSTNGAPYGNNHFWLDGNEIQVSQRDFALPARKDEL